MLNWEKIPPYSDTIRLQGIEFKVKPIKYDIDQFRKLNCQLLPVRYNNQFYLDIVEKHSLHLCKLENQPIAAISCRKEFKEGVYQAYVMTLGVLQDYRRLGIASYLIHDVVAECETDKSLDCITLHVHIKNQSAINLYMRFGFQIYTLLKGYYLHNEGVDPPDAYMLRKVLHSA